MSNQDLKNQIIEWLQTKQPYWMQYLGNFLLEGGDLNEETITAAYRHYKEHVGLEVPGRNPEIDFNKMVPDDDEAGLSLVLEFIRDVANVNALAAGQVIKIGPRLTLIYGNNGTGKSGYVRLLNNVFPSRGDKLILQNVFDAASTSEPACTFTFKRTEDPYDLTYPADRHSYEFAQFGVFDTRSVREHLEKENQLSFVPSGFDFFEKLLAAQTSVRERFDAEIAARSAMHDFGSMFTHDNEVSTFVAELSAETDHAELSKLCTLTDAETAKQNDLTARLVTLEAADKSTQVEELTTERKQLADYLKKVEDALANFDKQAIKGYSSSIESANTFENLVKAEGIQSFEKYNITQIGSAAWRSFIHAGRSYADAIEKSRDAAAYPSDGDSCLLCLQPFGEEQKTLIQAYWDLLKSNAQNELNAATQVLDEIQLKIGSLPDFVFDDSNTVYKTVKNFDAAMATKWSGVVTQYNAAREAVLAAVIAQETNELPKPIAAAIADFDECLKKLDTERTTLIDSNPEVEKAAVQREIAVFEDRLLLAKVQKKAEAYINDSKWAAKARLNMKGLKPTKITNFAGELYNKHISDEYLAMFNEECRFLDAPTFVKISQRNTKGSTVRSLKIEGRSAIQILSEGEQRAIALADFLTEARMDPLNRGLFFDDPVSSQDHDRRENIAHRLVELAKGRQIIVFTHEISFLQRMKAIAEEQQVDYEITTVRKASGTPGIINPELPLPVMKVGKRIGWLRDRLVKLTKLEKNGEDDEYYLQAKAWYAVLRESWERAVEELVFKDVVQRYDPRVQTQRLNEVNVTDEMIGAIEKAMTASSSWVHDQPAALNPKVPTSKDAERDLASLADFVELCKTPR